MRWTKQPKLAAIVSISTHTHQSLKLFLTKKGRKCKQERLLLTSIVQVHGQFQRRLESREKIWPMDDVFITVGKTLMSTCKLHRWRASLFQPFDNLLDGGGRYVSVRKQMNIKWWEGVDFPLSPSLELNWTPIVFTANRINLVNKND